MKIIKVLVWPWLYVTAFASTETDVTQTEYLLHSPENPDVADVLPHDASSLGNFNPARRTFVLMHGLGGDAMGPIGRPEKGSTRHSTPLGASTLSMSTGKAWHQILSMHRKYFILLD